MSGYFRGQMAKLANVNMETLRYYEGLGLIPSPDRSEAGYRLYSEEALHRLTFIHNAKLCGFTLKEIKKSLVISEQRQISIDDFIRVIDKKIDRIHADMAKKEATLSMLAQLRTDLQTTDKHDEVRDTLRILNMDS